MIRKAGRWYGGWILLLLGFAYPLLALDPNRALDHYGHQVWRTDSGLPQNTVHAILQTHDGCLWLGTDGGLVRFDGLDLVTFDTENTPQLANDTIYDLFEDKSGTLWISSASGLVSYRDGIFSAYSTGQGLPADIVWFTFEDRHQRLWAITSGGPAVFHGRSFTPIAGAQAAAPLNRFALAEDTKGTLWLGGTSGVFAFDTSASTPRLTQHLLSGVEAEAIEFDRQGTLWVGTSEGLESNGGGSLVHITSLGKAEVTALAPDTDGSMWVGTATGLAHVTSGGVLLPSPPRDGIKERINRLFRDRQGVLWIAMERGVVRLHSHQVESFAANSALATNRVLSLYEDREGSLWLGTDSSGLNLLRDQKFTTYTTDDGLSGNFVRCVFQDANGELWIGTDGSGLNRRTPSGFTHYSTGDGLSSNVILSLAGAPGGGLWVGTPNGLNLLHPNLPHGGIVKLTSASGLPDDFIRSLTTDRDGSLWIGTRHGLAHLANGKVTSYSQMDGLGSDFIGAIVRDGPDLWVGTSGGLSRLADGRFTNYTTREGLSNNTITAIAQDHEGSLWLGTNGGGLNSLRNGRIQAVPAQPQRLPGTIYGMVDDGSGHLWLSSKTGIFRITTSGLDRGQAAVTAFGTADGMNIRECSGGGHPAAWKLEDGSLWFATLDGASSIYPAQAPENRMAPPVVIEKILVNDRALNPQENLILQPGTNRLEIGYAGLSFVAPQKVQYRYRLEGFDRSWIEAGTRRAAFYTNLPPGHYRFRVMAANNDGVWNTAGASFGLRLMPHYYQTWWFYSALAISFLLIGYLIYRWRVLQVETQWSAVLRERGRIAREIHDTLAQGFVGISVQLELVARLLTQSAEAARGPLDQARALVRASLEEARTSIWNLRSQGAEAEDLPSRLSRNCTRIAAGSESRVYLQVKGTYRPLERRVEEELLRIGQEAVANGVRHAGAVRIDVQLIYEAARVSLQVEDNGRGFTPGAGSGPGHYGIRGMRERAGEIDAAFVLESAPGKGTRVLVEAPVEAAVGART
jgi:ligand-binding sensor domain-containing protein/signal transduction histidine kinase